MEPIIRNGKGNIILIYTIIFNHKSYKSIIEVRLDCEFIKLMFEIGTPYSMTPPISLTNEKFRENSKFSGYDNILQN